MKVGQPQREIFVDPLPELLPEPLRTTPTFEPDFVEVPAEPVKEPVHDGA